MKRGIAAVLLLLSARAPAADREDPLRGFGQARSAWQLDYERRLLALPRPKSAAASSRV